MANPLPQPEAVTRGGLQSTRARHAGNGASGSLADACLLQHAHCDLSLHFKVLASSMACNRASGSAPGGNWDMRRCKGPSSSKIAKPCTKDQALATWAACANVSVPPRLS